MGKKTGGERLELSKANGFELIEGEARLAHGYPSCFSTPSDCRRLTSDF
jgi:hypothetical protein